MRESENDEAPEIMHHPGRSHVLVPRRPCPTKRSPETGGKTLDFRSANQVEVDFISHGERIRTETVALARSHQELRPSWKGVIVG